ncbi:energy-coupling factor ABC transporter ATP-binding protein [Bacillus sp. AFS018417]|uniref:energy-coupling factor ABC transporter ATP-binding protein n=1 Tax=Bacillus TaxID=1386 RepID=UPI000BFA7F1E|nr:MULTISPECIES: energy-coupling factor ABC transporter ATP-binding protein [unclassified Bacillus (in: firmicutes)]MCP1121980.1 energy-coupling factor ABC transporter ATP-binding protein [Bacillus sp. 3103sda1]PEZ04570.1 energy-coupling factor ABC transporter ATP-binding protein [Bacillus sp. AFS018417]
MEITFQKVEHRYQYKTPFEKRALYDIDISLPSGGYYAIIGHTGSGKSTMIQHLNGLLQPTSGTVQIGEYRISSQKKAKKLKPLRKKVGVVFQFPEHQLFEETVEKDICFGPSNFGVSEEAAKQKAKDAIRLVGLSEELLERSPFELSGGQMRRVAIAGVLAMEPEVLVLDEPTAGLDPKGQNELMEMFYHLHKQNNLTVILVTHNMEDAAKYADNIVVMHKGTVFLQGTSEEVFTYADELEQIGVSLPMPLKYKREIEEKLGISIPKATLSLEDLADEVIQLFRKGGDSSCSS